MRAFLISCSIVAGISMLVRARYKILNAVLAVGVLRKFIVTITMNMPYIREKILPSLFGRSAQ